MSAKSEAGAISWIETEYGGASFGDPRLGTRLAELAQRLAVQPDASLPKIMVTDAELEACYRFHANEAVTPSAILAPHRRATYDRVRTAGPVVAIHDGTEFDYTSHQACKGIGHLTEGRRGFLAHLTLIVTEDGDQEPLGVPELSTWSRPRQNRWKNPRTGQRRSGTEYAKVKDKETQYWRRHICQVAEGLQGHTSVVHVVDAGGEFYDLLAFCWEEDHPFVTLVAHDQLACALDAEDDGEVVWSHITALLTGTPIRMEREVTVSARRAKTAPRAARKRPARDKRVARVSIAATSLTLKRPRSASPDAPPTLDVNVVLVSETDAPEGEEPVQWILLTSEPIATCAQIERVVHLYVQRFQIEVYIDAVKNGCLIEQRRLQTATALQNLLATSIPIAWQLMRLRALARAPTPRPAGSVLSPMQLAILQLASVIPLSSNPDAAEVLRAIAKLGGNIGKRNPGWRVLMRGFTQLMQSVVFWTTAKSRIDL
jgi:hypothetical protein